MPCRIGAMLLLGGAFIANTAFAFRPAAGEWEVRVAMNGAQDKPRKECFRGDEVDKFVSGNERGMFRACKRRDLKRTATELSASYDCERGTGEMKYSLPAADRLAGRIVMRETTGKNAGRVTTLEMNAKRVAATCSQTADDDEPE